MIIKRIHPGNYNLSQETEHLTNPRSLFLPPSPGPSGTSTKGNDFEAIIPSKREVSFAFRKCILRNHPPSVVLCLALCCCWSIPFCEIYSHCATLLSLIHFCGCIYSVAFNTYDTLYLPILIFFNDV